MNIFIGYLTIISKIYNMNIVNTFSKSRLTRMGGNQGRTPTSSVIFSWTLTSLSLYNGLNKINMTQYRLLPPHCISCGYIKQCKAI